MRKLIVAMAAVSISTVPVAIPASAFPVDVAPAKILMNTAGDASVQAVAFRHLGGLHSGGFHHGGFGGVHRGFGGFHRGSGGFRRGFVGFHRGFGGRRLGSFGARRFYGGRRFGYGGYGLGAGVAGLAAGAIIGGTVAAAARDSDAVASCERRFKSYNPRTGTYLGYDGLRHRCP